MHERKATGAFLIFVPGGAGRNRSPAGKERIDGMFSLIAGNVLELIPRIKNTLRIDLEACSSALNV